MKINAKKFAEKKNIRTFAIPIQGTHTAEIAQLVEHNLAKVGVASSSLVFRSKLDAAKHPIFLRKQNGKRDSNSRPPPRGCQAESLTGGLRRGKKLRLFAGVRVSFSARNWMLKSIQFFCVSKTENFFHYLDIKYLNASRG